LQTLAHVGHGRRYRRPLVIALYALVLNLAGLVLAPASPAAAAKNTLASVAPVTDVVVTGKADCPGGYVCFWVHAYYQGPMGKLAGNNLSWGAFPQSQCATDTWEDCASSTFNNGNSCAVDLYTGRAYTGYNLWEQRGSYRDNLALNRAPDGQSFNDRISSNVWCE
jgi:hypothetical protein